MKLSAGRFLSETKRLEELLDDNFDAVGMTIAEKVQSVKGELPIGVVDKLNFLSGLYERAKNGAKPGKAELKQAGYWIDAVYPYLSQGAERRSRRGGLVVAFVAIVLVFYLVWRFIL